MKRYLCTREDTTHSTSKVWVEVCSFIEPDEVRLPLDRDQIGTARGVKVDRTYPLALHTLHGNAYPKSPDGHAWGYGGSGPCQLAIDVLWDYLAHEPTTSLWRHFLEEEIAPVQAPTFVLTDSVIRNFLERHHYETPVTTEKGSSA